MNFFLHLDETRSPNGFFCSYNQAAHLGNNVEYTAMISPHLLHCFCLISQHPALCVISEEKILDAIMMWAANKDDVHGWEDANGRARTEGASLFQDQMEDLKLLLPLVRFSLIPLHILQMVS